MLSLDLITRFFTCQSITHLSLGDETSGDEVLNETKSKGFCSLYKRKFNCLAYLGMILGS